MGPMLKKLIVGAVGAVVTAYVTKVVTAALERKPLKTRMREGKEKVVDIKNSAVQKAQAMKADASSKMSSLIDEKDQGPKDL